MNLTIRIRDKKGKNAAKKSRRADRIPGVLYGREYAAQAVEVDTRAFQKALLAGAGDSHLIDLVVESASGPATEKGLIKAIQRHPVTDRVVHVDFYRVRMTDKIEVDVSLVVTGTPVGVKKGGVMEKRMDTIRVRCLPANIPEKFMIDVADLDVGGNKHVSDLQAPLDVTILDDAARVLAVVTEIKEEKPAAAEVAAAVPAEGAPAAGAAAPAAGAESKGKAAAAPEAEKKEGGKDKPKK